MSLALTAMVALEVAIAGSTLCTVEPALTDAAAADDGVSGEELGPINVASEDDDVSDDGPGPEEPVIDEYAAARELANRASAEYEQGEFLSAIELWEQTLVELPRCQDDPRAQFYVPLAFAYWEEYLATGDERHLRKAHEMFSKNLETLRAREQEARADTEEDLAKVEAELGRVEAERLERDRQAAVDDAIAQERDYQRRRKVAERDALTKEERRRFTQRMRLGGSAVGLGVVSVSAMAVGLRRGELVDGQGEELAADPSTSVAELQTLRRQGVALNRMAWVTGSVGGALLVSGAVVVVSSVVRYGRSHEQTQTHVRLAPRWKGLEVRF